jgi:hypothetical protein
VIHQKTVLNLHTLRMENFTEILQAATAAVSPEYFLFPIDGGPSVWRERVYCYELYHQLRRQWPDDTPFRLNGEVDKSGHPLLQKLEADGYKPDLLVHTPGDMHGNAVVIEVKPCNARPGPIEKDLQALHLFTTAVEYRRGVYLIYGGDCNAALERIRATMEKLGVSDKVEVWTHEAAGLEAVRKL